MGAAVVFLVGACGSVNTADDQPREAVWRSVDIGNVGVQGGTELFPSAGTRVLRGSGEDVWNEEDSFHYSYQLLSGDGSLTVRVDGIEAADEWTKVGVMVREDLSSSARNAFMLLTDAYGVVFQGRLLPGAVTSDTLPDGHVMRTSEPVSPWWLRIERVGDTVVGSHSPDGVVWSELGRLSLALPHQVLIGTAVTSRNNAQVATGTFSEVRLERDEPLADDPVWTGPTTTVSYSRDGSNIPNPERGFYVDGTPSNYASASARGFTLGMRYVRLDDFRYSSLPEWFLTNLRSDLAAVRGSGIKLVLRFSYNFGFAPDAPVERVLEHIGQVAPILREYADVIAVLQTGFVGAWGEWHSSTHDLLTYENRRAITSALLAALPPERMIQIRTPYHARDLFALPTASTAFSGLASARVGHMNDCFLTGPTDTGTYLSAEDFTYAEAVGTYTVVGGETCHEGGLASYNDGWRAVEQMTRFHFDYLNAEFWQPIIDKWREQGYYEEIASHLGYRYVMQQTTAMTSVAAGQTLSVSVRIENEGYGKLYNPRPLNLVLVPRSGGAPVTLRAHDDARTVLPLSGETRDVPLNVRVPSGLTPGVYDLHLALPDAASTLAGDARYAIRMANLGTWNATTGRNDLNLSLRVD